MIQLSEFFQKTIENYVHIFGFAINLCKKRIDVKNKIKIFYT
jgi:hypothetical protein